MDEANPFAALGEYDLRHLIAHLVEGGRADAVHAVLMLDHAGASAWYEARHARDDLAGYLDDLEAAGRAAAGAGDVARRVAYMTMLAAVRAYSGTLPPMLQAALVEAGEWTAADVMVSVRAQVSAEARARALVHIGGRLHDAAERARLAAQAVEEARRVGDSVRAARMCSELAVDADEDVRGALLDLAAAAAVRIPSSQDRYAALTTLADRTLDAPPATVEAAVAGVLALLAEGPEDSQARSLAAFVPRAAPAAWPAIAERAAELGEPEDRALVLGALLAAQPSDAVVRLAERCLEQLDEPTAQLRLAARLPDGGQQLREAWGNARGPASLGDVLDALDHTEGDLRAEMLAWCLEAADAVTDGVQRLEIYAVLGTKGDGAIGTDVADRIADELLHLRPRHPGAEPLGDATKRLAAVVRLAAVDPELHAPWAGLGLQWCRDEWGGGIGFGASALHHVARVVRGEDVGLALELARTSPNEAFVSRNLEALAPRLSPEEHADAVGIARELTDSAARDDALSALAVARPAHDTVAAIGGHARRREIVNELAGRLAPEALGEWIALGGSSSEPERTARLQLCLLGGCEPAVRDAELDGVLAAGRQAARVTGLMAAMVKTLDLGSVEWDEVETVGRAAAADEARTWWLDAAIAAGHGDVASEIVDGAGDPVRAARVAALTGDRELMSAAVMRAHEDGAVALARVAGALPPGPLTDEIARHAFESLPDDADGAAIAEVVAACVAHVSPETRDQAAELARHVDDYGRRARLLAALDPDAVQGEVGLATGWLEHLEQSGSPPTHTYDEARRELFCVLAAAAETTGAELDRLVAQANANENSAAVAAVLDGLASRCPDEIRAAVALSLAAGLKNPVVRRRAIGYVHPAPSDPGRLAATLDAIALRRRRDLLGDLACLGPLIAPVCPPERAEELVAALSAIDRWWP
ncbi:MAG TPA: hypothetical protein VNO82_20790 [Solirubrobacteraceae bacterium]|nr:hypothetical protein [Solirubrobacteraceae bacterium]